MKAVLVSLLTVVALSGCALLNQAGSGGTEQDLAAAGFRAQIADTPAKVLALTAMKQPYTLRMVDRKGQPFYIYPDPSRNILYIGSQKEYDAYQKLVAQQNLAGEQAITAMQEENAALDWGMWYPGIW